MGSELDWRYSDCKFRRRGRPWSGGVQSKNAADGQLPLLHRLQMFQVDVVCLNLRLVTACLRIKRHLRVRRACGKMKQHTGTYCLAVTLKFEVKTLDRLGEYLGVGQVHGSITQGSEP